MTPDATWKAVERRIAKSYGGRRSGPGAGPDTTDHDRQWRHLALEVKHRKRLPKWLTAALEQATANAGPDQIPVVMLHEKQKVLADVLVVLRKADFDRLPACCTCTAAR